MIRDKSYSSDIRTVVSLLLPWKLLNNKNIKDFSIVNSKYYVTSNCNIYKQGGVLVMPSSVAVAVILQYPDRHKFAVFA